MTEEVSDVFTTLTIPHKTVCGMDVYYPEKEYIINHMWIMVETPLGEVPFESTFLVPVPGWNKYYNYTTIERR